MGVNKIHTDNIGFAKQVGLRLIIRSRRGLAYLVLVAVANLSVFNAYAESVSSAESLGTIAIFF